MMHVDEEAHRNPWIECIHSVKVVAGGGNCGSYISMSAQDVGRRSREWQVDDLPRVRDLDEREGVLAAAELAR